jgi:hypothetical protein
MTAVPFKAAYSLPVISNPGMISPEEEQLYFHLARTFWSPDRFYLEFGTWLGRSTTRICQGLETAAPGRWRLNCYDQFLWHADHIPKAEKAGMPAAVAQLRSGDSFRDAFLSLMGDYRRRITTFEGSVRDAPQVLAGAFPPAAKLGVLFVDASKGWDNCQLLKAVALNLAHDTRIVFQDFFMNSAASLQLLLMMLPQLEPETVATNGGSLVVRVTAEIDPDNPIFQPNSIKNVSADVVYKACQRLRDSVPAAKYDDSGLALTLPLLLWKRGYETEAHRAAEDLTFSAEQWRTVRQRMARQPVLNIPPLAARAAKATA